MIRFNKLLFICLFLVNYSACADVDQALQNTHYLKVVNVAPDDTLNLRASASGKSDVVLQLPHNATRLIKLDQADGWYKLAHKNITGWAYDKYLAADSQSPDVVSMLSEELFCIGTEPHWTLKSQKHQLQLKKYDDIETFILSAPGELQTQDSDTWVFHAISATSSDRNLQLNIRRDRQCSDEMSDDEYKYSITVTNNQQETLTGCCNKNK